MKRGRRRYFGQVRKRGGRWSVRVRVDDGTVCRTFGTDRNAAEAFLARLQTARATEGALGIQVVGKATWLTFWPTLEAWLKAEHATSTFDSEKAKARVIGRYFKHRVLADIGPADVRDFLTHVVNKRGGGDAAVNRYRALLSIAFKQAILSGFARTNPTEGMKWRREQEKDVPYLEAADIDRILGNAGRLEDRDVWTLAADTGLRRSELLALEAHAIDLERGYLTVTKSKGKRTRTIRLTPRALAVAERLVNGAGGGRLFPRLVGDPSGVSKRFGTAAKAAGFPTLTFHGLRHAYGSGLAAVGVKPGVIGTLLGDTTARVIHRYSRHAPDRAEDEAMDRLAKARGQAPAKATSAPLDAPRKRRKAK